MDPLVGSYQYIMQIGLPVFLWSPRRTNLEDRSVCLRQIHRGVTQAEQPYWTKWCQPLLLCCLEGQHGMAASLISSVGRAFLPGGCMRTKQVKFVFPGRWKILPGFSRKLTFAWLTTAGQGWITSEFVTKGKCSIAHFSLAAGGRDK